MISLGIVGRSISQLSNLIYTQISQLHSLSSLASRTTRSSCIQLYTQTSQLHSLTLLASRTTSSGIHLIKTSLPQTSCHLFQDTGSKAVQGCSVILNAQQVRLRHHQYYSYSAWKRINKFGIEKLLSTNNGRTVLWRKFLKGKHNYAAFEQLLPSECYGRVLPKHQKHLQKHKFKSTPRYIP